MSIDIAIIGISGRFPDASNIEDLCLNLKNGKDSVREISEERVKSSALPSQGTYMKLGYIEDIDKFDYNFFKISLAEAQTMDPIQRLLLEVTYETIENAGYNIDYFRGTKTSVYVGDASSEYYSHADSFVPTLMTGNSKMFHAARIARQFDFTGNAMMVDSACSSSLVAVQLACNELILGQSEYAIVAGINLYVFPYKTEGNDLDIWSPDGVSRAFSANANGMSRGEVVTSILLKPLKKAIEEKDIIHAVIKGYSVNNNGSKSSSPSAPDSVAQAEVIKEAWAKAGIDPLDIGYIEAHGSGTQLGDSLEIEGLNMAFNSFTNEKQICPISTIKNNIGHGMAAAGLTALIKGILTLKMGLIFPTIHFDTPNPIIDFKNSAVYVNDRLNRLDTNKKYVGITSLGASGVNCHLVLERAPEKIEKIEEVQNNHIITISSRTSMGLKRNIKALYDRLMQDNKITLKDISYTLNIGRKHYDYRFAIVCDNLQDLKLELKKALDCDTQRNINTGNISKVIMIFSHYDSISEDMIQYHQILHPLFDDYYKQCMALSEDENCNKKVFAFQYSFYKLLINYGIKVSNILGIGIGKIVSSVILGQMSLEAGIKKASVYTNSEIGDMDERAKALIDRETSHGDVIFIEMGTESLLSKSLKNVRGINDKFHLISMPKVMMGDTTMDFIKNLYTGGVEIDWRKYHNYHKGRKVELPSYQFEKTRCWLRDEPRKSPMMIQNSSIEVEQQSVTSILKEESTYLQQKIANMWCEVLKLDSISLEDDFFEIGGDSIKATSIINKLNKDLELKLSFEDLFDFPTIKLLDNYIIEQMTTEKRICNIWREVLKLDKVKSNDNFFSLGGHSLMANQVLIRIHKEFGLKLNFENIFQYQTVSYLSEYIDSLLKECSPVEIYQRIESTEQREYYETSPQQKRAWVLNKFKHGSIAYNTAGSYVIEGSLNYEVLDRTFATLIERHESLRTVFIEVDGQPKQKIIPLSELAFSINRIDLRLNQNKEDKIKEIIKQEQIKQFDLKNGPLLRVNLIRIEENKHLFIFVIHHIISDGWSLNVLFSDMISIYDAYSYLKDNPLKPLRIHYKDYSEWEAEQQRSEIFKKHCEYWMEKLSGTLPILELPSDRMRPSIQSFNGDKFLFKIDKELTKGLMELCRKHDSTLFMGLVAVINVLFYRYTGQNDIILGFPIAGRRHADLEKQIGYYVNTLPLRTQFNHGDTFIKLLHSVKNSTLEAYEHQEYHFDRLVSELNPKRDLSRNTIFDVMVVLQNSGNKNEKPANLDGLLVKKYEVEQYTSKMDLLFEFIEEKDEISVSIEFNTDIYYKSRIEMMACHLTNLIRQFIKHSCTEINKVDYISRKEVDFIENFNNTSVEYPKELSIHNFLQKKAFESPKNIALITNELKVTYEELNTASNKLASYLRKQGIGRESIVAIYMKRSIEMIVGIFAILKAGGAYLPISTELPDERINFMLRDSKAKVILVNNNDNSKINNFSAQIVDISDTSLYNEEDDNIENINLSSDLAYVIYTSGTTGEPKGVMIEHHSVINRLNWMQRMYTLKPSDVILQKTPYSFDVSVWEIFWWSFAGASLCILKHGDEKNPEAIIKAIECNNVTTIHFVPPMLDVFLEYIKNRGAIEKISSLRQVFASGEALLPQHVVQFNQVINMKQGAKLINLYGPTEATVDVSFYNCPLDLSIDKILIGKPIDNIKLYVLDKNYNLQPIGIPGELCIAGDGLARGYLNRPELNKEKFAEIFLHENGIEELLEYQKCKIYRTGDIARLLPSGNIEFLGRIDHQVKIRGYRIELGEIENCIINIEDIKDCVVVDINMNGNKQLCAHVVTEENISVSTIRSILMNKLPDYMVPDFFVQLKNLPLNHNGKVDRNALPYPQINMEQKITEPTNATEIELIKIWSEILGIDEESIGTNNNFFDIGGNSLNIITLSTKITEVFSKSIKVEELFRYSSISSLAQYISIGEGNLELTNREIDESVNLMERMICYLEDEVNG